MTEPDAIVLSDLHLGSENCQAKLLVEFLNALHHRRTRTRRLILNGDVFDSIDFRRLKKSHWKVLSLLRKLSDEIDVTPGTRHTPVSSRTARAGPAPPLWQLFGTAPPPTRLVPRTASRRAPPHPAASSRAARCW